jgi:hypothetical protein
VKAIIEAGSPVICLTVKYSNALTAQTTLVTQQWSQLVLTIASLTYAILSAGCVENN